VNTWSRRRPSYWKPYRCTSSGLRQVTADDATVALRLLVDRRDTLGWRPYRDDRRLTHLLLKLVPGGAKRFLSAQQAQALLASLPAALIFLSTTSSSVISSAASCRRVRRTMSRGRTMVAKRVMSPMSPSRRAARERPMPCSCCSVLPG
jgi:hypothetical protein